MLDTVLYSGPASVVIITGAGINRFTPPCSINVLVEQSKDTRFIVFSDSKSSLEALNGFRIELDLVLKIIKDYTSLIKAGKVIKFCWIPSHVNIPGNERADTAAKSKALNSLICADVPLRNYSLTLTHTHTRSIDMLVECSELFVLQLCWFAFSALTLLVENQEAHPACKKIK